MIRRFRVVLIGAFGVLAVAWLVLSGDGGRLSEEETIEVLAELGADHRLAYSTAEGVALVDFGTGDVYSVPQQADALSTLGPYLLLYEGNRTLGVNPASPTRIEVLSSGGRLVATDTVDVYAFVSPAGPTRPADEVFIARLDSGFIGERLSVPPNASIIAAQGLGVLVTPEGGGTLAPSLDGFEKLAAGTVVAAIADAWIETTCTSLDDIECETVLVGTESEQTLGLSSDVALGSALTISPDTAWVLQRDSDDAGVFLDVRSGAASAIDGEIDPAAVWAPDSSYVAWLDEDADAPVLHVAFPDGREPMTVDLSVLGATTRSGPAVMLL